MPTAATPTALQRLLSPLVAPHVFDFWASRLHPTWSWQRPLARVVERRVEARDAVTLVLQPNRHFAGFVPGQHVHVSADIDGVRVTRSYSLTGLPRPDGRVSITVRRIDQGRMSTHLCRRIGVGDVVELGPAFGDMTLAVRPEGRWLFLAAGSGITPLMGLTRQLAQDGFPAELTLIYWAKTRAELCFAQELRELAARAPRFRLHLVLTRETDLLVNERSGRLDAVLLQDLVPDLASRRVYACGPAGFVATARQLTQGIAQSFSAEAFTPPMPTDEATGTVRVELRASGRTLEIPAGQALLPALEAQGVTPAYGCRMGICNTCACGKLSGTTQDLHSGDSSAEASSALRLCISRACTDLILDL
ncbi:ferredoxin reductase [Fontimonas sp. SYSU GA230001]|uniref:ferredoxin reductase n=1 Tax=Fontimonas sp. SYSU GA230001 TaxID=3142450 RepID=UPI0032B5723A